MCSGLVWMFPGLSGLPAELLSTSKPWSARHSSSSSRRENSSPGRRCRLQTEHLKHSMWYTFSRALITRSLLQKPMLHFAHLMPNNLEKGGAERRVGLMQKSSWIKKKKSDVQIKKELVSWWQENTNKAEVCDTNLIQFMMHTCAHFHLHTFAIQMGRIIPWISFHLILVPPFYSPSIIFFLCPAHGL